MNVLRTTKRLTLNVFITDMLKELITSQFPILEISFVLARAIPSSACVLLLVSQFLLLCSSLW